MKCTCIRCKTEALVRSIYPHFSDAKIRAVAEKIVKAMRLETANRKAA